MVSLLRKKRQSSVTSPSKPDLRHSLSLPDLTTPLLDPASWEEIPSFSKDYPSLPNTKRGGLFSGTSHGVSTGLGQRNRSPSLISGPPGSPVAFHRPFRGDNAPVVTPVVFPIGADFRKSTVGWNEVSRDGSVPMPMPTQLRIGLLSPHTSPIKRRAKSKGRTEEKLNILIAGGRGCGKTSFIKLLSDSLSTEQTSSLPLPNRSSASLTTPSRSPVSLNHDTPCSPTSPGPPMGSHPPSPLPLKDAPTITAFAPTTKLSSQTITVNRPRQTLVLRLIDTPGLDVEADDGPAIHAIARERGVSALLGLAEGRFGEIFREERKVIRKGTAGADSLVHLCIYLIDARSVLNCSRPDLDVDWSITGLFDDTVRHALPAKETCALALSSPDLDTISALAKRINVHPILTHADALSLVELDRVKAAVRASLRTEGSPGFGIFDGDAEDDEVPGSPAQPRSPISPRRGVLQATPPTPALTDRSITSTQLPYAIFCPQGGNREFAWGRADAVDEDHSDLIALKEAILETHVKSLRASTREVLYEKFRTERLLANRARKGISEESDSM